MIAVAQWLRTWVFSMEDLGSRNAIKINIVNKKNWNTKEDKGKFMTHVLHVLRLAKTCISG